MPKFEFLYKEKSWTFSFYMCKSDWKLENISKLLKLDEFNKWTTLESEKFANDFLQFIEIEKEMQNEKDTQKIVDFFIKKYNETFNTNIVNEERVEAFDEDFWNEFEEWREELEEKVDVIKHIEKHTIPRLANAFGKNERYNFFKTVNGLDEKEIEKLFYIRNTANDYKEVFEKFWEIGVFDREIFSALKNNLNIWTSNKFENLIDFKLFPWNMHETNEYYQKEVNLICNTNRVYFHIAIMPKFKTIAEIRKFVIENLCWEDYMLKYKNWLDSVWRADLEQETDFFIKEFRNYLNCLEEEFKKAFEKLDNVIFLNRYKIFISKFVSGKFSKKLHNISQIYQMFWSSSYDNEHNFAKLFKEAYFSSNIWTQTVGVQFGNWEIWTEKWEKMNFKFYLKNGKLNVNVDISPFKLFENSGHIWNKMYLFDYYNWDKEKLGFILMKGNKHIELYEKCKERLEKSKDITLTFNENQPLIFFYELNEVEISEEEWSNNIIPAFEQFREWITPSFFLKECFQDVTPSVEKLFSVIKDFVFDWKLMFSHKIFDEEILKIYSKEELGLPEIKNEFEKFRFLKEKGFRTTDLF